MFMNEKKHMSKKKKLTIVISAVIALGLVCAGGTWWYVSDKNAKEEAVRQERYDEAKEKFNSIGLDIDEEKAISYIQYLDQGDKVAALDIYKAALDEADGIDKKLAVLGDLSTISNYNKEYDHLLYSAQERLKIDKSIESYYNLIIAYIALDNYEAIVKTYEELLANFDALTAGSESSDEVMQDKQMYQEELNSARELLQIKKENNGTQQ